MKILCLETSTPDLSLAVAEGEHVVASASSSMKKTMAANIIPAVDRLLKRKGWKLERLDGFIVGLGPGSFTSLRVGLATVKGLAFALNKPVAGISSLDVLAAAVKDANGQICVMADARRDNVYSALYQRVNGKLTRVSEYLLSPSEDVLESLSGEAIITGSGIALYRERIESYTARKNVKISLTPEKLWKPQAKFLLPLGLPVLNLKKPEAVSMLVPMYLYPEDCQVQR